MSSGLALATEGAHGDGWKRYPVYKDSGVEWIGAVPEGWKVQKLKHIASVKPSNVDKNTVEGEHPVRLCNYVDVYYNDYITSDLDLMKATASVVEIGKFILREGDILITKDSESWDDIAVPAYVSSDFNDVLCGYHLAQIRPNTALSDGEYLFWSFCAHDINDQFRVAATGITRYGLGKYWIDNSLFLVPPKDEQRAIAAFLDRETGRIDALIAKKERQIELLQEKRAALISHVVTKGLDPDAPMKDSGVEWLGEVPEHWESVRLKWVAKMESGHTPNKKVPEYWMNCDIPWVSLNDTAYLREHDYIEDTNYRINELGLANSSARLLPSRAVVFTRDATIGLSAITTRPMAVSQHIIAWLCEPRIVPEYLLRVFYAMAQEFERLTMGSTIKTIGMPDVNELKTPVPPLDEQISIVKYVLGNTDRIDMVLVAVLDNINLLREYRTALISVAVTGKIDVREELVS